MKKDAPEQAQEHPGVERLYPGKGISAGAKKNTLQGGVFALDQSHGAVRRRRSARPCGSRGSYFEMLLGVGHDLRVAGMIGGFHRNDAFADLCVLLAQIFGKLGLGAGRACGKATAAAHRPIDSGQSDEAMAVREKLGGSVAPGARLL
jgi:hypothetical protein